MALHRRLILLVALSAIPVSASSQSVDRIVHASVLDRAEHPVTGVAAGELSDRNAGDVSGEVQRSGIVVDAFVVAGSTRGVGPAFDAGRPGQTLTAETSGQPGIEHAVALAEVIKSTGGRREDLVTAGTLGAKLRELAARLNNQYRVIYEGPPSLTAPASIEIVTTRPDLRVRVTGIPENQP